MKKCVTLLLFILISTSLSASTFYCDPVNGSNSNPGTIDQPFDSLSSIIENNMVNSFGNNPLPYDAAINTLVEFNSVAPISGGDTLILMNGLHGFVFARNYVNKEMLYIIGADDANPIIESIQIQGGAR